MKTKKILLISCSVILLCLAIIAGTTFALFTDSTTMRNHLVAGNLDVVLTRTNLKYNALNDLGELDDFEITDDLDFTESSAENVFGVDGLLIVPGSYFEAELEMRNRGNVAFDYNIQIVFIGEANLLADQIKLTLTRADGSTETKKLSELGAGLSVKAGKMTVNDHAETFSVRVEFIDLEGAANNPTMNTSVEFDLVVTATQATAD